MEVALAVAARNARSRALARWNAVGAMEVVLAVADGKQKKRCSTVERGAGVRTS